MAKRVYVWGTFDLLHEGHKLFLQEAASFGGELYVQVVPDRVVRENKKRKPRHSAEQRMKNVESLPYVTRASVDSFDDGMRFIEVVKPDVVCFGFDQDKSWAGKLINFLNQKGLHPEIVWLVKDHGVHTSDLIKKSQIRH